MATNKNIIIGAAQFWIATETDEITAAPTLAPGTDLPTLTGWREVGYTTDGVEISYEPDYGDVEVDQLLDSAVIFKQGMRVTVNTTLMEATLENLLVVWGQTAGTLTGGVLTIESGDLGDYPLERSLLFRGPAPRGGTAVQRWYHINRAIQTESTAHALRRAEATSLPASFRCLPDDDGEYGTITDRASA